MSSGKRTGDGGFGRQWMPLIFLFFVGDWAHLMLPRLPNYFIRAGRKSCLKSTRDVVKFWLGLRVMKTYQEIKIQAILVQAILDWQAWLCTRNIYNLNLKETLHFLTMFSSEQAEKSGSKSKHM